MPFNTARAAFSSLFRYEHVALKGSIPFTTGTSFPNVVKTYAIPHNLGYKPFFRLWYGFNDGKVFELSSGPSSTNVDGNGFQIDNVYPDTTNLNVVVDNAAASVNIFGTIYYRIYAEPQA